MKHAERARRLQPGEYSQVQELCVEWTGNGKIKMVKEHFWIVYSNVKKKIR